MDLDDSHSAANKAAHSNGYTLGNQHPDFTSGALTQEQVDCLVEILNTPDADRVAYFSDIDTGLNPVLYSIVATANASACESYYNGICQGCHGDPAAASPGGSSRVASWLTAIRPSSTCLFHKAPCGEPLSIPTTGLKYRGVTEPLALHPAGPAISRWRRTKSCRPMVLQVSSTILSGIY